MADDVDNVHHHYGRGYGYGHHDHHRFEELRTDADYRSLVNQGSVNGDRINSGVQVTGDRINAVGAAGAAAACRTNELVQGTACKTDQLVLEQGSAGRETSLTGFAGVHDRLCDSTGKIIHEIDRHGDASALAACKLGDQIAEGKHFNAVQFKDQVIEANKNSSNISNLVQTVGNAAQVLATTIGNAASVQATANYNGTTVQIERVRAELDVKMQQGFSTALLEATRVAAAAELRAANIASAAAAKAAECCCELKELIRAEHTATRQQASDFRMRDLEGRLNRIPTGVAITIPPGL